MKQLLILIVFVNLTLSLSFENLNKSFRSRNLLKFIEDHRKLSKEHELSSNSPVEGEKGEILKSNKSEEDVGKDRAVSDKESKHRTISSNTKVLEDLHGNTKENKTEVKNNSTTHSNSFVYNIPRFKQDIVQSGALLRGFYVFLGLSVMTLLYFVFRSYRIRHGTQPPVTVRKYGIIARRGDVEMLPLPLDDDEDDDTLFEVGNHSSR